MSKFTGGLLYWWGFWIGAAFLIAELAARYWAGCPWPTLSRTTWDIEADWEPFRVVLVIFLAVLCAHLVFRLTAAALIAVVACAAVAAAVHLLTA